MNASATFVVRSCMSEWGSLTFLYFQENKRRSSLKCFLKLQFCLGLKFLLSHYYLGFSSSSVLQDYFYSPLHPYNNINNYRNVELLKIFVLLEMHAANLTKDSVLCLFSRALQNYFVSLCNRTNDSVCRIIIWITFSSKIITRWTYKLKLYL